MPYGIAVGALAAGASVATATADPTVTAYAAGTVEAADLTVQASDSESIGPVRGLCECDGLDGRPRGRRRDGEHRGQYGHGDKLHSEQHDHLHRKRRSAVTATNDTDQMAVANSDAFGLIAAGGNSPRQTATVSDPGLHGHGRHGDRGDLRGRPHGRRPVLRRPSTKRRPSTRRPLSAATRLTWGRKRVFRRAIRSSITTGSD